MFCGRPSAQRRRRLALPSDTVARHASRGSRLASCRLPKIPSWVSRDEYPTRHPWREAHGPLPGISRITAGRRPAGNTELGMRVTVGPNTQVGISGGNGGGNWPSAPAAQVIAIWHSRLLPHHQSSCSRYQATVCARPTSKSECRGFHPSSR